MASLLNRAVDGFNAIRQGLSTVFKHTFREPITKNYPDEMPTLSPFFRGRLALTVNPESGEHLCISCRQCERVCPDKCIKITSAKSAETNKLELINFEIDHGLCMFCGLCTEVCPTFCIINTNDFEMSDYSREALIYDLKKLTLSQEESAYYFAGKENPLPKPKPVKAAAPAAAPAAATPAKPAEAPAAPATPAAPAAPAPAPSADVAKAAAEGAAKNDADTAALSPNAPKGEGMENAVKAEEAKAAEAKAEPKAEDAKPEAKPEEKPEDNKEEPKA